MWFSKKRRRGTFTDTIIIKHNGNVIQRKLVTIELEEIEKVGIFSRLKVISVSGGVPKDLVQGGIFSGLFLSSDVEWIK